MYVCKNMYLCDETVTGKPPASQDTSKQNRLLCIDLKSSAQELGGNKYLSRHPHSLQCYPGYPGGLNLKNKIENTDLSYLNGIREQGMKGCREGLHFSLCTDLQFRGSEAC